MKSIGEYVAAVAVMFVATTGAAMANLCGPGVPCQVPEPTSLALVGLALLGAGVATRRRKA